jgi:hypothetical protein
VGPASPQIQQAPSKQEYAEIAPGSAIDRTMKKRPTLPPPVGYKSWLAYAVATMETRSLYNELSWGNEPQWPESTTRTQMQEAADAELRCYESQAPQKSYE